MAVVFRLEMRPAVFRDLATVRVAAPPNRVVGSQRLRPRTPRGVPLIVTPTHVHMIGTDAYRVACTTWAHPSDVNAQILIPVESLRDLLAAIGRDDDVLIYEATDDSGGAADWRLAVRTADGTEITAVRVKGQEEFTWLLDLMDSGDLTPVHEFTFYMPVLSDVTRLCPPPRKGTESTRFRCEILDGTRLRVTGHSQTTSVSWQYHAMLRKPPAGSVSTHVDTEDSST